MFGSSRTRFPTPDWENSPASEQKEDILWPVLAGSTTDIQTVGLSGENTVSKMRMLWGYFQWTWEEISSVSLWHNCTRGWQELRLSILKWQDTRHSSYQPLAQMSLECIRKVSHVHWKYHHKILTWQFYSLDIWYILLRTEIRTPLGCCPPS